MAKAYIVSFDYAAVTYINQLLLPQIIIITVEDRNNKKYK